MLLCGERESMTVVQVELRGIHAKILMLFSLPKIPHKNAVYIGKDGSETLPDLQKWGWGCKPHLLMNGYYKKFQEL